MSRRKLLLTIIFFFALLRLTAQQNNIWYFGSYAGISFNRANQGPIPYAIDNSAMLTTEACASICDASGNLLFYTNGQTIYNRLHAVMANGDGLAGHISAFQGALIVPQPNSDSLFYVFTTDGFEKKFVNGYNYSVVDISRNNGDGEVIAKNIPLLAPGTERLAAARHVNGVDVWVITNDYNSNVFRAWLATCTGLQPSPVISTTGEVLDQFGEMNSGGIKVSPDGRLLCQTHFPNIEEADQTSFFQLFDFDNVTGIISNARKIEVPGASYRTCEFSPDSKLLYLPKSNQREIDQFDVTQGSVAAIIASKISLPSDYGIFGIQSGPDGKIYLNHGVTSLSVISSPNTKGAGCRYESNKIKLDDKSGKLGLPSFINDLSFNPLTDFTYQVLDTCAGKIQFKATTNIPGAVNWFWDFSDGGTSTIQNPQHSFADPGQAHIVKLKVSEVNACGYIEKSKEVYPAGIAATADYSFQANCDSQSVRFTNESFVSLASAENYFWDFGDGQTSTDVDPVHIFSTGGAHNVKLAIHTGMACINDSITQNISIQKISIQASPDATVDEGTSLQLNVAGGGSRFQWSPSTWLNDPSISSPITTPFEDIMYQVTAANDAGCTDTDSVFIRVNTINDIYVPSAFTPNDDNLNDVLRPYIGVQFKLEAFNVYSRWGKLIFTTNTKGAGWDGKINSIPQTSGVFVWTVQARAKDGKSVTKKGTVTLIR